MEALKQGSDALFILLGGIMVLAMHAGFAFLELGTVRKKNQVNALVKILTDFSVSTVMYFVVGFGVAYGTSFFVGAEQLAAQQRLRAGAVLLSAHVRRRIPAIISGGIAERARFGPQLMATAVFVGFVYPLFEGVAWNHAFGSRTGSSRHRRGVPRLRRFGGGPRHGRLDGAAGGDPAGRAQQPLSQGRRDLSPSAVQHSLPGAGRLDPDRGLVRLQRHERRRPSTRSPGWWRSTR